MRIANRQYNLTPKGEFYLIGYGGRFQSRREPAKGVHDPIMANALLIETDGKEIFLFNADYIEFLEEFCNERKKEMSGRYGLDQELIFFSATHNHQSVRDYHKTWETGKYNREYEEFLTETVYRAYEECREAMEPATVRYGKKVIEGYYGNRNNPGRPADNEVIKLEFIRDGAVVAGLVNWAVHSTVLSPKNDLLTAELAGMVREAFARRRGYRPLMIVGAAGDCSTRHYNQGDDFAELERVSDLLAEEIDRIETDKIAEIRFDSVVRIQYPVRYSMDDFSEQLEAELKRCEQALKQPQLSWDGPISPGFYAKCIRKKLALHGVNLNLFSTIVRLGDLVMVSIPGELASKFGLELKQRLPEKCVLILGYTNGFMHYIMPEEEYGKSMETIDSLYLPGMAEQYVAKIKKQLMSQEN